MVDWRRLFHRPPKRSATLQPSKRAPQLTFSADASNADPVPGVSAPTSEGSLQPSSSHCKTQNAANTASTTVGNGLKLSLGLLKEAVTRIGIPGLEAVVSGVVKIIEIIENVHFNERDLGNLSHRISSVAQAVSKAPNLHPKDEVSEALRLRLEGFLQDLQVLLDKVQAILGERNLLLRTANSQANSDAITDVNTEIDRLISQFSAEGIISVELNVAGARQDIRSVGRKVDQKVDSVNQKMDDVHQTVDGVKEAQSVQEYEALIEGIPRVHARYHDTATKPSRPCHQGTRIGLLQGINEWIQGPTSDASSGDRPADTAYLWLCGEVGVGKTTVAHTIAKEQNGLKQLGASFFFSRHDRDRQSPHLLFPSIAYQLARFDRGTWRALAEVLKPDPDIVNRGLMEQFTKLVLEPLSRSGMPPSRTVVIVIDGLDECSDPASVLDALAIGIEDVSVRLRILVCSRPYAAIQSKFKNTPLYHLASQNHFHDINPQTLSNDVAAFLTWSLGEIASRPANAHLPVPWPTKEQLDELIGRANGLFIIASTYEKYINDPIEDNPAAQLNRILSRKRIIGSSPLAELDALYDQVLDDLKHSLKTTPELAFAREIVEAVILAQGEMSLEVLAGLFSVEPSDVRSVLRRLTAVILLPEDQEVAITPFHASFGEYIQDNARCTIRELSVDTSPAHGRIADRCIATIVSAAEDGITGVETAFSGEIPGYLRYASGHLADHIASSHDRASGHRKTAMGGCIWTWLDLMHNHYSISSIRSAVERSGFEGLLHIEGVDVHTSTSASIQRLMTANHVLTINRASETSVQLAMSTTTSVEDNQAKQVQLVKINLPEGVEDRNASLLEIAREARCWNQHMYRDMFIKVFTVDLNAPTEVQMLVSSSTSFRGLCSLSEYLERMENLDYTSRIRLVLKIANDVRYLHETSPIHAHGWLIPDLILVSVEGTAILKPRTWALAESPKTPRDDSVPINCQMTRSTDWNSLSYWDTPGGIDLRSPQERRFLDIWQFGNIVFQIVTSTSPLTRYNRLAEGDPGLGYDKDENAVPRNYWWGELDTGYHGHAPQARFERAVSLLLDSIDGYEQVKAVLKACWAFRMQDRPSMREVVVQLEAILQASENGL